MRKSIEKENSNPKFCQHLGASSVRHNLRYARIGLWYRVTRPGFKQDSCLQRASSEPSRLVITNVPREKLLWASKRHKVEMGFVYVKLGGVRVFLVAANTTQKIFPHFQETMNV